MIGKNKSKMRLGRGIFGLFFVMIATFGLLGNALVSTEVAYADPVEGATTTENTGENNGGGNAGESGNSSSNNSGSSSDNSNNNSGSSASKSSTADGCQASLGPIAWFGCSLTEKVSEAVDWLYDKIQEFLVINPIEAKDGSPFYEVWKYCLGLTNIVFIIFLLVVIYSQITGVGITNYGIKKALPKLVVVAVLVNLSFLICQLAVDLSNVIGNGLRGLFTSVEDAVVAGMQVEGSGMTTTEARVANAEMFHAIAGGSILTIAGTAIAFETGAIWMLIPTVLGAIVAVATGLITIALRQAVVVLLVMISPLAVVAYMLPNTEELFKKWRKLLTQMLVFYPMFSLLFGASSLAGFAIIAGASDGFGVILGTAVQIFPLFFSWKLMQMSGTFLGTINTKMRELTASPMAKNRGWADSHRLNSKQKRLASGMPITPSLRLMQFVSNRKVAREAETSDKEELVKNRGLAYRAGRNYNRNGVPTRRAEDAYRDQARTMEYQRIVARDKNNLEKGLTDLAATKAYASAGQKARMEGLDNRMIAAADYLKVEQARGEKITYDNATSYHKRMEQAMNAHFDAEHAGEETYRQHDMEASERAQAATRYSTMSKIMEGNAADVQFAAADAAHAYDTQKKILETKYQKYFELTPPTKDVEYRLGELTKLTADELKNGKRASENIDAIMPGLRILNQRGDTDLVKHQLDNLLSKDIGGGVELGTHASQALASFLMFEVKDNDPYLRRFGKYINLETARAYNKNDRKVMSVTYDEYVKGYHDGEPDLITEDNPTGRMYAKKDMVKLMEGTSFDGIERTALDNYDSSLRKVYTDANGVLDLEAYEAKRTEVDKAVGPQFISANLKFLSGSEQIVAAVKSKTGFFAKQDKKTGEYSMVPIWDDEDEAKKLFGAYNTVEEKAAARDKLKGWYREQTLKYLNDQTAIQIVGLRSDYHEGLREHLSDAFEARDRGDLNDDQLEALREYEQEISRIQTQYGDSPIGEAKIKRDMEMKEAREILAGAEFRRRLDDNGTLLQIYRSRRSGASNAAKPFVRKWLKFDDERAIRDYEDKNRPKKQDSFNTPKDANSDEGVAKKKITAEVNKGKTNRTDSIRAIQAQLAQLVQEEREELEKQDGANAQNFAEDDEERYQIYDDDKRQELRDSVEDLYYNMKNSDDEDFYEESLEYLTRELSEQSYIVQDYERYHREDPYADKYNMKEYLLSLLTDSDNF